MFILEYGVLIVCLFIIILSIIGTIIKCGGVFGIVSMILSLGSLFSVLDRELDNFMISLTVLTIFISIIMFIIGVKDRS